MNGVTFYIDGEERYFQALDDVASEAVNLRRADEKLYQHYSEAVKRNLDSEGGNAGGWEPLSDSYAEWKAKHYPGKPTEQREGTLYRSLTDKDAEGAVHDVTETDARYGSRLAYARRQHQVRPLIALTDEDVRGFGPIVLADIAEHAREKGLDAYVSLNG